MCNRFRHAVRKAGLELEVFGFEEISDLPQDIYPDRLAPVIRRGATGDLRWQAMRWGFPPPPKLAQRPITNVRNLSSPYWRGWLKPEWRCLVPFDAFAEWSDSKPKREHWFELASGRPGAFAGIWRPWTGVRGPKAAPVEGEHLVFAFLTCTPNGIVAPVHAKAMPVILDTPEAQRGWLEAPVEAVLAIACPLEDTRLRLAA